MTSRTPLFAAEHSERYERQKIIREYQELTSAKLIVIIDSISPTNMTIMEELLVDLTKEQDLHLILCSPGGDGETAIRMVRSMQQRCRELTVIVPDMAKSAATIICLGAHHILILMGPGGDLGPIDPQMILRDDDGLRTVASAKEIVAAVAEAEERTTTNPASFPLFASMLADVNMLMVEQAKAALARSEALMTEALTVQGGRFSDDDDKKVEDLVSRLKEPLINAPASHSSVISIDHARRFGLPAESPELESKEWQLLWNLWTRYFSMGCWPRGNRAIYEGELASHVG